MTQAVHDLLEQHFDTAFAVPDGIAKLRELILTLAMQGKLVEQDPNDPPARELLKEIEAEKQRLIAEKKIRNQKPLPPIKPEEVKHELPSGWEWVRLGDIGNWKSGSTPSRSNPSYYGGDIPWVKSGEVKQGRIKTTEETITQIALEKCSLGLNPEGSVLVAMYGANIGEVGILQIEATTNQAVCACQTYTHFDENYLLNLITSMKPYFLSQGAGAAQPNISREKIIATVFPLPPLPEQHRIVRRIDQLMARCDELEKLRKVREEKRLQVHTAAIKKLLKAPENAGWPFIQQNFGELYTVKHNVAELRKAILELAVMGRLVPQELSDPPASELLKEIETEKQRLIAEKKIKKQKPLPPIKPAEVPYKLPQGWTWVRLGVVVDYNGRKNIAGSEVSPDCWLLDLEDIEKGTSKLLYRAKFSERQSKSTKSTFRKGDVLYGKLRPYLDKVIVADNDGVCTTEIVSIVPFEGINSYYVRWLLKRPSFLAYVNTLMYGVKMPRLGTEDALRSIHPLPPSNEQQRIVARIDQLMDLCDKLDARIEAANKKQETLLNAVMAQI